MTRCEVRARGNGFIRREVMGVGRAGDWMTRKSLVLGEEWDFLVYAEKKVLVKIVSNFVMHCKTMA